MVFSEFHPDGFRRDRYYAYDRKTKKKIGRYWRLGKMRQVLREKGYRCPRT